MKTFTVLVILVSLLSVSGIHAQNAVITGRVTDESTSDPLPFVNIGLKDQPSGTFSDESGHFKLEIPYGTHILVFSCVGYSRTEKTVTVELKTLNFDVTLKSSSNELNTVVVSASRYAQRIQESITSIEVLKPDLIERTNAQSIDQALEEVPGVTIVNEEPQIRGGSGFSSGLGSRVMIMVDEIPVLRGDAGRPVWSLLPVDDIEQVEVLKGASSVVYGSSAINGAINVRTAWPGEKPSTKLTGVISVYSKPERRYATPWTGMNPFLYSLNLSHMQRLKDNVDLVIGIGTYNDQGYIGPVPAEAKLPDTVLNTGEYDRRIKFNFNSRVRSKKIDGLTYGLNGNLLYTKNAKAFFWYDSDTNIYRPFINSMSNFEETIFYLDPFIKYFSKHGNTHSLKNRFMNDNSTGTNNQEGSSYILYNEYQFQRKFSKVGNIVVVAGVVNSYVSSSGKVFSGILGPDSTVTAGKSGHFTSDNFSVYIQLEKMFFKRLNLLFGSRYEYYRVDKFIDRRPVFRAGLNLQAAKGTFFRVSVGQGYRSPSIGERYITTNSGNFGFYPNPGLKSETSVNYEVGAKQVLKIHNFIALADLALFYQDYNDYVEFNFGMFGKNQNISKNYGFKFLNTGPARIYGFDAALSGDGEIARGLVLSVLIGYTYSIPESVDTAYVFYRYNLHGNAYRNYSYNNTSSDSSGILKYRVQSLAKGDVQISYRKWSAGCTERYYGYMKNIDSFFYELDSEKYFKTGIKKYREMHSKGTWITDIRLSYAIRDFKFSVLINNLFNKEFSLRPLTVEAPRTTSLQVIYKI